MRGRLGDRHGRFQHDRLLFPRVRPDRPGGQAVCPARLHEDVCDHRLGDPLDHRGADARLPSAQTDPVEQAEERRRGPAGGGRDDRNLLAGVPRVFPLSRSPRGPGRDPRRGDRRDHIPGRVSGGTGAGRAGGEKPGLAGDPRRLRARAPLGAGPQGRISRASRFPGALRADNLAGLGQPDLADRGGAGAAGCQRQPLEALELAAARLARHGPRVHAALGRGFVSLHAVACAGGLADRRGGVHGGAEPGDGDGSGGGERRRQGGPRGIGPRPRADRDDRDDRDFEARGPVAQAARGPVLRRVARAPQEAAPLASARPANDHQGRDSRRASPQDRHSRRAAELAPADPDPDRDAAKRLPSDDGRENLRLRSEGDRADRAGDGDDPQEGARGGGRGRRPDRRQALSRIPHRSREDRPLRSRHPRRSGGDRGGHRRREPDDVGGGARAVSDPRPLSAPTARQPRGVAANPRARRRRRPGADQPGCRDSPHARPPGDQERELAAGRLRDAEHARPRRSERRRGGRRPDPGEDRGRRTDSSTGILLPVGRAV